MKLNKSRIFLISDLTWGGAAIDCSRLFDGLRELDAISLEWRACDGDSGSGVVVGSDWPSVPYLALTRIVQRFDRSGVTVSRLDKAAAGKAVSKYLAKQNPSLINLHNIHEQLNFDILQQIPRSIPIVWTLHDMWPLTGYCCYSFDCDKYLHACQGECPQAGKWGTVLRQQDREWQKRQSFFDKNQHRITFVAPSQWLVNCAEARFNGNIRVEHIPYGLDLAEFKPLAEKNDLRRILGLSDKSAMVLVCAASLEDERKGTRLLVEALSHVEKQKEITVVAVGKKWSADWLPSSWVYPGVIRDTQLMNLYYNAADVFVLPSLADNLPNTLVESTAAGTPCVTFDVGGCAEVVRDGKTGFVAQLGSTESLAECILRVLNLTANEAEKMRQRCRLVAEEEYSQELQAKRYLKLFDEMMEKKKGY